MKLQGADFLSQQMKAFGPTVSEKAGRKGVGKAAQMVRRSMRQASPKPITGKLRKALSYKTYGRKQGTSKTAYVGLRKIRGESRGRWYYRTLEMPHKGGAPYNPFFKDAWESSKKQAAQIIIDATATALYAEAAKVYQKSLRTNLNPGRRR
jgi:hypothetical protein